MPARDPVLRLPRAAVDLRDRDVPGRFVPPAPGGLAHRDRQTAAGPGPIGDPYVTGADFVYGRNDSGVNPARRILSNRDYVAAVNDGPDETVPACFPGRSRRRIHPTGSSSPDTWTDNLGIPRPRISYGISDYVRAGFASARAATTRMMDLLGATDHYADQRRRSQRVPPRRPGLQLPRAPATMCGTHVMGARSREFRK